MGSILSTRGGRAMLKRLSVSAATAAMLAGALPGNAHASTVGLPIFNQTANVGTVGAHAWQQIQRYQVDLQPQSATVVYLATDTSSTTVEFDAGYVTQAEISSGCNAGSPVCDTVTDAWLTVGSDTVNGQTSTCTTGGAGCTSFGAYYDMTHTGTLSLTKSISHGVLQTVTVPFQLCGDAAWYQDTNNDSNPYGPEDLKGVSGTTCASGTVTVTPVA